MSAEVTPRVNAGNYLEFRGSTVRVIGKLLNVDANQGQGQIDANGPIGIQYHNSIQVNGTTEGLTPGRYYEIVGKVSDNSSIRVLDIVDFGTNINENAVNYLVEVSAKAKEMFY